MGVRAGSYAPATQWGRAALALGSALALVPFAPAHAQVSPVPSRDDLSVGRDGFVHVPKGPGLGVEIDYELIEASKTRVLA